MSREWRSDDAEAILAVDFEIGHFLCEHIIPRSVLYFTGEVVEDDGDDDDDEGEKVDEEGEGENEENDPANDSKQDKNPAECTQQDGLPSASQERMNSHHLTSLFQVF